MDPPSAYRGQSMPDRCAQGRVLVTLNWIDLQDRLFMNLNNTGKTRARVSRSTSQNRRPAKKQTSSVRGRFYSQ